MEPLTQLVSAGWGDFKTGKTTIGLTWPKPMVHLDLDQGFHRAEILFQHLNITKVPLGKPIAPYLNSGADIITKPYAMPIKWGTTIEGCISLWNEYVADMKAAYESTRIASLFVDPACTMWKLRVQAHLERAQQRRPDRIRLQQIEYGEPNMDMRGLLGGARKYGKSLILMHSIGGVYEDKLTSQGVEQMRVGDTHAGFSGTGGLVDMVFYTNKMSMNGNVPNLSVKILNCGLVLTAEGLSVENASFDSILSLVNRLRGANV